MKLKLQKQSPVHGLYADEFDKGPRYTNWRPHGNGDWLLMYTVGGAGVVGTEVEEYRVTAGDVVLYEIGAPQVYYTAPEPGRWHFLWAHFMMLPQWKTLCHWPATIQGIQQLTLTDTTSMSKAETALREVIGWVREQSPLSRELALNAFERLLLLITAESGRNQLPAVDPRIKQVIQALNQNYSAPFNLADIASQVGLSVSRFSHLFREQTGETPQRYAEARRLAHAAHLLRLTQLSIKEIADACGYTNAFYFSNRFRHAQGISPISYRQKVEGNRQMAEGRRL
ncbi:MAG: AraC family transcriptional regulator [Verrucomicrobiota bacterium]|nr:AraC family transcriptional regulator [Verrucomicrobiota bacterium]